MFTRQPIFSGATGMEQLNLLEFKKRVSSPSPPPEDAHATWLVVFHAPWHPTCVALEPVLAELSLTYGTKLLKFGKVDVTRYPQAARDMGLDTSGSSRQLPTLVLFQNGRELARIPHVYPGGKVAKGIYRRDAIVKGFNLNGYSMGEGGPTTAGPSTDQAKKNKNS